MSEPHRVGDLDIAEDPGFQRKEWTIQRVGWVVMLLIVVLALLGLFGTGPLSSASEEADGGALAVEYQRFVRHDGRSTLSFEVDGSLATDNQIELWIAQDYLAEVEVQSVSPEPAETRGAGNRTIFVFTIDDPGAPLEVSFSLKPQEMGRYPGKAGVTDGPTVTFDQISYP